jgi:hypothetical protein
VAVWIGSRNLTGSTDLDAGILMVSSKEKAARPSPDLGDLAEDLLEDARLSPEEVAEIRSARWKTAPGVSVRSLLWRRHGQTRPFIASPILPRADRGCAVSPFVDHDGLDEVLKAGAPGMTLLTTETAGNDCAPFDHVEFRVDTAPEPETPVSVEGQQEEAAGEFIEPPSTGIHAKLVAVSKGDRTALLLGSANLTKRGLIGPNAEAVALLDITDPALAESLYQFVEGGLALEIAQADPQVEERERAKRALDGLISAFLESSPTLAYGRDCLVLVVGEQADEALALALFEASPFLEPDAWTAIPPGSRSIRLLARAPAPCEQTSLVTFRARSLTDSEVCRTWVQALHVEGLDLERRDRALLAHYVGASRFRDWLRSLLDGVDGTGGQRWSDSGKATDRQDPAGQLARIFTLETMLAAWARDRDSFESRVAGMMAMLDSFEELFAALPDEQERAAGLADLEEVRPFLQAVHHAVGAAA